MASRKAKSLTLSLEEGIYRRFGRTFEPEHIKAIRKALKRANGEGEALIRCQLCEKIAVRKRAQVLAEEHGRPGLLVCNPCYLRENSALVAAITRRLKQPEPTVLHLVQRYQSSVKGAELRRSREASLTLAHAIELWVEQRGVCALSGRKMTAVPGSRKQGKYLHNASIDRKDGDRGYVDGNVHWTCWGANLIRQTLSIDELASWCGDITRHLAT